MEEWNLNSRTPASRTTWFILFWALTASVLVYGAVVHAMGQSVGRPSAANEVVHSVIRPILYLVDFVVLTMAVVIPRSYIRKNTNPDPQAPIGTDPVPSPQVFQQASIVSLSLSESCAISGLLLFFLGEPAREFWNFAGLTLLFNLAYILPRGVRYWSTAQNQK
jgi:hypothetical protein